MDPNETLRVPMRNTGKPKRRAPTDGDAAKAWDDIMRMASEACLIVQAYGGVATLAVPEEQRRAGIRQRVLDAEEAFEAA